VMSRPTAALGRVAKRLPVVHRYLVGSARPVAFAGFGRGSRVIEPFYINRPDRITIGEDCELGQMGWLSVVEAHRGILPTLRIGDRVRIGRMLCLACTGSVSIGSDVLIGDHVFIGDSYHDYHDPKVPVMDQPMSRPEPVVIEDGVRIGARAGITQGVTVGAGAFVAPGAIVTRPVPPGGWAVGSPARIGCQDEPISKVTA
jgi:acetyltransferase-like isoleucine patch superfamily enzyme